MVRIMLPNGSEIEIDEWVSTEDLEDPSSKTEKKKEAELRETAKIEQLRKKLYVPLTRKDHLDSFSELAWVFSSL